MLTVAGCAALNPNFGDEGSGTGGGSDSANTGTSRGTDDGSDSDRSAGGTGSETSGDSEGTGTSLHSTSTESSPGTSTEGERDDTSTTDEVAESGDRTELAAITLFASQPMQGDFGVAGPLAEAGAARCNMTLRNGMADLDCAETLAIVGSNLVSVADLDDDNPELAMYVFEGPDGVWLANTYDEVLAGSVAEEFNASVFSMVGGSPEEVFWWGGGDDASNDCQGWNVAFGEGFARSFQLEGPVDDGRACNNIAHLLCACLPVVD